MTRSLLATAALLSVAIAAVHLTALNSALYWIYSWLDECMHLTGGALLSVIGVWLALTCNLITHVQVRQLRTALWLLLFVLMVSAAWEIFEVWAGIPIYESYARDTMSDFIMDVLGGALAYGIMWHCAGRYMTTAPDTQAVDGP
jgi:hypothetical protein